MIDFQSIRWRIYTGTAATVIYSLCNRVLFHHLVLLRGQYHPEEGTISL